MKRNLSNYNLIEIYECLSDYYPIGLNLTNPNYQNYSGQKKLKEKIRQRMNQTEESTLINSLIWKSFLEALQEEFPINKVEDISLPVYPSFGGNISIFFMDSSLQLHQKLNFFVSLIGRYYTIYGTEIVLFKGEEDDMITFGPNIIISPIEKYKNSFLNVSKIIKSHFKNFKYIPVDILSIPVNGLYVEGIPNREATINEGLFLNYDLNDFKQRGDRRYGIKEWLWKN